MMRPTMTAKMKRWEDYSGERSRVYSSVQGDKPRNPYDPGISHTDTLHPTPYTPSMGEVQPRGSTPGLDPPTPIATWPAARKT